MANREHVDKIKKGVPIFNSWRGRNPSLSIDLAGEDFTGANFSDANLFRANLKKAVFKDVVLLRADLTEAALSGAILTGANLSEAVLTRANLSQSFLISVILSKANLRGADLTGALVRDSIFGDTDLSDAIGLDACDHRGPSVLDHATLMRSGPLPLAFLRGCGLPNNLIEYLPSLLNQAIQFYSCFISYSTDDQAFAERIHADLQNKGVRCWFAPHMMKGGEKIHEQIDEAIRMYDRLLLILSEHSMKSRWVKTEIANARKKELTQGRKVLFPIRLVEYEAIRPWKLFDADVGDDSAAEVREYFIPDFSNWKNHDSYKETFDRLVRDLQAKDGAKGAVTS